LNRFEIVAQTVVDNSALTERRAGHLIHTEISSIVAVVLQDASQ